MFVYSLNYLNNCDRTLQRNCLYNSKGYLYELLMWCLLQSTHSHEVQGLCHDNRSSPAGMAINGSTGEAVEFLYI